VLTEKEATELRRQLTAAEEEIAKIQAEFDHAKRQLDAAREEYRYIAHTEEAQAALREAEARVTAVADKLRTVRELRDQLRKELEEIEARNELKAEQARKELPEVVREFYRCRRELVEAILNSVSDLEERLNPLEQAVERYYRVGERLVEVVRRAGEYHGGGWVFSANDLTPPARRLWRVVIAEEKLPEAEVDEEKIARLRWWLRLLEKLPRLRADFPACVMTLHTERALKSRAEAALRELEQRRREHRKRLQRRKDEMQIQPVGG
jgi:hypothetical protein